MTIDLRGSTDYEVLRAAKVLARIDGIASEAGVHYLVVGATARSLISIDLLGTTPQRQTKDIDIAAEVDSWDEFANLVRNLEKHGPSAHKFIVEGTEVDVLPYGGIERANRTIKWPDDHEMNVLGLREAADSAQTVDLPYGISVKVPTIPALVLLKLLAWRDRYRDETRDALDLATMIEWYSSGKYFDRLYDEDIAALEKFDFDPPQAGAWLLGSHIPVLLDDMGVAELLRVLDDQELMGRLARDMGGSRPELLVRAMGQGVREAVDEAGRPQSGWIGTSMDDHDSARASLWPISTMR
ncbi:nucleotidyl transferase AbiEii/AbiGii toxin family protein [Actinokineospora xionganensis]|uniref:Nucleotidyl transferase AbiEii/AbiGii toxin family protein n=1 Tax=Actinokineospora xionganensis TaxID=2684470 RepID=A0ABR7LFV0_9PSEU|nr:nucleotidyl transferase AbiEii/AbiGii toxin family protein [Actinokineospora xionganensis]MBC6451600.1 nucleotidyl transferase AbiEii/AbiGii toxin family protein [Actinokineospora xionganensis]